MKKKMITGMLAVSFVFIMTGCCLSHDWKEATCIKPKICSKCKEREGEALGHSWKRATCTEPRTCSRCGETEGESRGGHDWEEATCTEPRTCSKCGETEGEALGHSWQEVTCTEPKTCSECGETEGESLGGHDWEEATCTEPRTCKVCGETEGEELGHDWTEATCVEVKTCYRCHTDGFLGRHRMDESTGICEICGKELRIALDTSNWGKYLESEGFTTCRFSINGTSVRWAQWASISTFYTFGSNDSPPYYYFEDAVIEASWVITQKIGRDYLKYTQTFRAELDRNGAGDFGKNFNKPDEEMTLINEIKSVSGFVIYYEDEYERSGVKERRDL